MSLPKKWFIIRDDNNFKEINEWYNKSSKSSGAAWATSPMIFNSEFKTYSGNRNKDIEFKEITFEQFKTHILKEETTYEIY